MGSNRPPHRLSPKVHWSRAIGYCKLEMFDNAEVELHALPTVEPWRSKSLGLKVEIRQLKEDWPAMRELAHGLRVEFPDQVQWWVAEAYAVRRSESTKQAREILLQALVQHYDDALVRYNLACYACVLGSPGEALDFLKEAVRRNQSYKSMAMEDEDLLAIRPALINLGWDEPIA